MNKISLEDLVNDQLTGHSRDSVPNKDEERKKERKSYFFN